MKRRIVVVAAAVAIATVFSMRPERRDPEPPVIELHRTAAASYTDPAKERFLFVLIIGSDVREGDPKTGRSDSLHLLAVDTKKGAGTMVGIPRDSYVPIPGHGTNKINASLFFGGPGKTVETVSKLTGIKIQYWASVEFSRFRKLVDTLGGVEVNVPYAMKDSFSGANFKAGKTKMNGAQALAFARNRHDARGGDFGRSENQGRLLLAALEKFHKDAKEPLKLAKYFRAFDDLVATDVGIKDLLRLARIGRSIDPSKVRNVVVPGRPGSAGGASVVFLSPGDLFKKIRDDALL
jgi:polyisoprenyl-teichoic acid--peptidoglycan teichoic acid transferase